MRKNVSLRAVDVRSWGQRQERRVLGGGVTVSSSHSN